MNIWRTHRYEKKRDTESKPAVGRAAKLDAESLKDTIAKLRVLGFDEEAENVVRAMKTMERVARALQK